MPQRIVPGCGPPNARIAFVGEAPGETEEQLGLPFVGASGKLLTDFLAKAGINRGECYLTNVMKTRPPSNNFGAFYADPKRQNPLPELQKGISDLHDELRRIGPNVICCLGAEPLRALTGKRNISSWRGSILASPVGKVVSTFHPSYILRSDFSDAPTFQLDLRRVKSESNSGSLDLPQFHFEIQPSFERVRSFLHSKPKRLSIDIETSGNLVRCIGLADSSRHAICIPFTRSVSESGCLAQDHEGSGLSDHGSLFCDIPPTNGLGPSYWTQSEEWVILKDLYDLLADPTIEKVLQNFPFDSTLLSREMGLHIAALHMDTLLAQHTCHPELQKGLDYQASIYTRIPYWSDYDASSDSETWTYNCFDCCSTFEISEVHDKQLLSLGLAEFYRNHVQPSMLALTRAQNRGILIDSACRATLASEARQRLEDATRKIQTATGFELNPNSPKQMQEFFYGKLKLQPQYKRDKSTREMKLTCDEDALGKLMKKYPVHRETLQFCLTYRENVKLLGTFLEGPLLNGRIYTSYNVAGTVTGRISSSAPIINPESGGNLQQIPRGETRRIFIAPPGWVFIKSDLKQADFWSWVWLARITRLIQRVSDPSFDVHRWNAASNIYHIAEADVTKEQRTNAKASVHGTPYGMREDKVVMVYPHLSLNEARALQQAIYTGIPEIQSVYWPETQNKLRQDRILWTPMGRRRMFMGRWGDDLFRQAYAHRPQSHVGDVINRAFHLGDEILDEQECYPLLQTHDEIDWMCREDCVEKEIPIIRKLMEYPVKFPGVEVPLVIPAEITVGLNWYDQKEVTEWLEQSKKDGVKTSSLPTGLVPNALQPVSV